MTRSAASPRIMRLARETNVGLFWSGMMVSCCLLCGDTAEKGRKGEGSIEGQTGKRVVSGTDISDEPFGLQAAVCVHH